MIRTCCWSRRGAERYSYLSVELIGHSQISRIQLIRMKSTCFFNERSIQFCNYCHFKFEIFHFKFLAMAVTLEIVRELLSMQSNTYLYALTQNDI